MTHLTGRTARGWYRMPGNIRVRAVDVERALTGIGTPVGETLRYVRRKTSPLVAGAHTYVWRAPT